MLIITIMISSSLQADIGECGELHHIGGSGITNWLYKNISSTNHHPNEVDIDGDVNCQVLGARAIQVTTSGNNGNEKAYYFRNHDDASNLRFRFLLDTVNLLDSFEASDSLVLYNFLYENASGVKKPFLKVRLARGIFNTNDPDNWNWEFRLQWFDTANGGHTYQVYRFKRFDNFADFEFFWNKTHIRGDNLNALYTASQAGVLVKVGDGINNQPTVLMSPYSYEDDPHANVLGLKGQSRLGAVNTSAQPLTFGDEIRILSPEFYNND